MTAIQNDYNKLEETKRSNLANEAERHRSNVANEGFKDREVSREERLEGSEKFKNVSSGVGQTLKGLGSVIPIL